MFGVGWLLGWYIYRDVRSRFLVLLYWWFEVTFLFSFFFFLLTKTMTCMYIKKIGKLYRYGCLELIHLCFLLESDPSHLDLLEL